MEWISAKEKLPENGERVILYTPYEFFGEDYSCIGDKDSIRVCKTRRGRQTVPVFTHWMPLPQKPDC